MTSQFRDQPTFMGGFKVGVVLESPSGAVLNSAIGIADSSGGYAAWSVTNLSADDRTVSGTESTAANIAASLATLVRELKQKGIIN